MKYDEAKAKATAGEIKDVPASAPFARLPSACLHI